MPGFARKGLLIGALAATIVALSAPAAPVAAAEHHHRDRVERHHGHGRVVVRHRGAHGVRVVRFHRLRAGHFARLTLSQRAHWTHGRWWHGNRHGRLGWWWWTGGIWYWYPAAVYPYPTDVSAEAVYDYAPEGRSDDSWYYCEDPEGYYPYVKSCNGDWKPVPIEPQANTDGAYGEPPYSGDEEDGQDDQDMDDQQGDQDIDNQNDNGDDEMNNDDEESDDDSNY